MKKKSIALLMATAITMTGCVGTNTNQNHMNSDKDTKVTADVNPTASAEDTLEPVVTTEVMASDMPQEENDTYQLRYPQVKFNTEYKDYSTDDGEDILLYYWFTDFEIVGDEYPELSKSVSQFNEVHHKTCKKECKEYLAEAKEMHELEPEGSPYSISHNAEVERSDQAIFSTSYCTELYRGGAHGGSVCGGATFDTKTGKKLNLKDVITDMDAYEQMAVPFVTEQVEEFYGELLFPEYEETIKKTINKPNWMLTNYGLKFIYNEYELAPYAAGMIDVQIPYSKLADLIKPEYMMDSQSPMMLNIEQNKDHYLWMNGKESVLKVTSFYEEEEGWLKKVVISIDGRKKTLFKDKEYGGFYSANCFYLRNQDGKDYLILEKQADNDWRTLTLFTYENEKLVECDRLDCSIDDNFLHSPAFKINKKIDLLGSYQGTKYYYVDADGKFATDEERYELLNEIGTKWEVKLKAKQDVLVEVEGKEFTLKKGDAIRPIAAEDTKLYFLMEDGREGSLIAEVNEEYYGYTINGVEEEKLFKGIMYAG